MKPTHVGYARGGEVNLKEETIVTCHITTGEVLKNATLGQAVWALTSIHSKFSSLGYMLSVIHFSTSTQMIGCLRRDFHREIAKWPCQRSCSQQWSLGDTAQWTAKLLWVHPGEAKLREDCSQKAPGFCCSSSCRLLPCSCSIWHGEVTI